MKNQNLFVKIATICVLPILAFLLSQCACCPPLSRKATPTFTGCWMTEFSQRNSADTSLKGDIHFSELPIDMQQNDDGTIAGYWVGLLSGTPGKLTGNVANKTLTGITIIGEATAPQDSIIFNLSESGLTFNGKYGPVSTFSTTRRLYWKGTKISNCKCSESIYKKPKS